MRCKNCDYPLWNLKTRTCPECGTPFLPSDYEFVPSSVQFCCPECDQSYYGLNHQGHLVPSSFACVSCHAQIDMDQMVLRPTLGVEEQQTQVYSVPWHDRRTNGWVKSWFKTCLQAMGGPTRLGETTVQYERTGDAWVFAVVTCAAASFFGVFGAGVIFALFQSMSGSARGVGLTLGWFSVSAMATFVSLMLIIALWGALTHGILAITGGAPRSIRRTYEAICYSSGICVFLVIPGVGPYCGTAMGLVPIWWSVSATLIVWKAQGVHGGRATLATLTFPVVTIAIVMIAYVLLIVATISTSRTFATTGPWVAQAEAQLVLDGMTAHAASNNGGGPAHGIELVANGTLAAWNLTGGVTMTSSTDVPIGSGDLSDFATRRPARQQQILQTEINKLPTNVVAHRVGDFVFTHHGINLNGPAQGLWLVVMCDDPDAVSGGWVAIDPVQIGLDDGTIMSYPRSSFPAGLAAQNALRANNGLAPLPDPLSITHANPAGAGDGS